MTLGLTSHHKAPRVLHFLMPKTIPTMLSSKMVLCLFCLIEIFCIFSCIAGNPNMKSCVETDKQALLKLKYGFIDEGGILSSWEREVDCCKWKGISCNDLTGHVTQLNLQASSDSTKLKGTISSSLCELQHLILLDLSFNDFEGQMIPKCSGSLKNLTELRLKKSELSGSIPSELQNLSNLQTLDLGGNYNVISNSLEWVSHLSSLRYLDLARINLFRATDWQSSISKIPSLVELHLNDSQLPKVNPKSFYHMNSSTHLRVLSLGGNHLSSLTLSWVFKFSKSLVHLNLSSNSLQYLAPDAFINMTSLQYLDLSNNKLEISSIKFICNLCQLRVLLLYSNNLSGQLSHWMQQSCCFQNRMEELDLSQNPFISGPFPNFSSFSSLVTLRPRKTGLCGSISQVMIPQSFRSLHSLKHLDLGHNNLSGSWSELTQVLSLETLDLSNNEFNGALPSTLGQLTSLDTLILSSNNLSGVISEAHLSTLSNLKILNVSQNFISFNFSSNWVPTFLLNQLSASSCKLGPNFPSWLKNQKRLELLYISDGGISDTIPEWFWDLTLGLKYLDLSNNKIHGALPEITRPQGLRFLDMSNNSLSGRLPNCWGYFQDLEFLNLAFNNLSGIIPNSIGTLNHIKSIHLNDNNLSGEMPSFLNSSQLLFIDFAHNHLSGNLPTWIGNKLPNLIVLALRGNKLLGNIPTSICNLNHLQILDLSENEITGTIPSCLDSLFSMSSTVSSGYLISYANEDRERETIDSIFRDRAIVVWKGEAVTFSNLYALLTIIDLSNNHLQGEIPHSITKLSALVGLNLSRNSLTGSIPNDISQLQTLEALDLSRNSLSGIIPATLSSLLFLSAFDLSFNNLSGEIPKGNQLSTFSADSYEGNQGLCGPPLTEECPRDATSSDHSDPDLLIPSGFYISMFFGFFIGFWGVCGTLTLKRSWRHAYFRFVSDMNDWIYVQAFLFMARLKARFQDQLVIQLPS